MAGRFARRGSSPGWRAPLQRPLPERRALRPTKRQHVDLTAELLRSRLDLDASERARRALRDERDGLRTELVRALADNDHLRSVIAKLREQGANEQDNRPLG